MSSYNKQLRSYPVTAEDVRRGRDVARRHYASSDLTAEGLRGRPGPQKPPPPVVVVVVVVVVWL